MHDNSLNLGDITNKIEQDGICCIPNYLSIHEIDLIKQEGILLKERFNPLFGETSPIKIMGGWRIGLPPLAIARRGGGPISRTTSLVASRPLFRDLCDRILRENWHLEVMVFDYREPTEDPLPKDSEYKNGYPPAYFWHSDCGLPGMKDPETFSLRFQIYLSETSLENGAVSYVEGSHRLVKYLRQRSLASEHGPKTLSTYDQIVDAAEDCLNSPEGLPEPMTALYENVIYKAQSWKHVSDDVVSMKAGSLFIFDDAGLHRVNPIEKGSRFIVRFQFLKTPKRRENLKSSIGRRYLKVRLNEPLAALL